MKTRLWCICWKGFWIRWLWNKTVWAVFTVQENNRWLKRRKKDIWWNFSWSNKSDLDHVRVCYVLLPFVTIGIIKNEYYIDLHSVFKVFRQTGQGMIAQMAERLTSDWKIQSSSPASPYEYQTKRPKHELDSNLNFFWKFKSCSVFSETIFCFQKKFLCVW